mmetsp:Transcript_56235/g.108514  ORF Transcript_56235/g.108514 Transcript_56235/m.108514 type:complete len:594 (+) Transcript_56235:103-1884(+)
MSMAVVINGGSVRLPKHRRPCNLFVLSLGLCFRAECAQPLPVHGVRHGTLFLQGKNQVLPPHHGGSSHEPVAIPEGGDGHRAEAGGQEVDHEHGHEDGHGHDPGHGGHGHAGHGDHGGHHAHHATAVGTTAGVMLLGNVAFVMALFYLVNWHDNDIVEYTWRILSTTVSIFCAVLIYGVIREMVLLMDGTLVSELMVFLALWMLSQGFLLLFKEQIGPLKAFGTLSAHITGFAGMEAFFSIQKLDSFSASWPQGIPVVFVFLVVSVALFFAFDKLRELISQSDGKEDEGDIAWDEQCEETENDVVALGLSFLMSVVIRYAISGQPPTGYGSPVGRPPIKVLELLLCGVAFGLLTGVATFFVVRLEWKKATLSLYRLSSLLQLVFGLTMSWCFYFGIQWYFLYMFGDPMLRGTVGKLLEALVVSFFSMVSIFVLDCIGDGSPNFKSALTGVIVAIGLLVGISWEHAFTHAIDELAASMAESEIDRVEIKMIAAVILVASVLPAWRLYILPKSDHELRRHYAGKSPPLKSLCCHWEGGSSSHEEVQQGAPMVVITGFDIQKEKKSMALDEPQRRSKGRRKKKKAKPSYLHYEPRY